MPTMILDVHTHVFPPRMIEERAALVRRDPGFAELYGDGRATMATVDELADSMERARIDVAVIAGFWWRDADLAAEHAEYLRDAAREAGGRLLPFPPLCAGEPPGAMAWAAGFGEWRPGNRPGDETEAVVAAAGERPLLVHATEHVGHRYPGKDGGLDAGALWRLLEGSRARLIAAHWGGGLPFFGLMPEVAREVRAGRLLFDSAASAFLYEPRVFRAVIDLCGVEAVAWGSDFPLRPQGVDRAATESALASDDEREAVLGGSAARFLGL